MIFILTDRVTSLVFVHANIKEQNQSFHCHRESSFTNSLGSPLVKRILLRKKTWCVNISTWEKRECGEGHVPYTLTAVSILTFLAIIITFVMVMWMSDPTISLLASKIVGSHDLVFDSPKSHYRDFQVSAIPGTERQAWKFLDLQDIQLKQTKDTEISRQVGTSGLSLTENGHSTGITHYALPSRPDYTRSVSNDLSTAGLLAIQHHITSCTPHHHVAFLKVHKTGSSTVANILQRFGFSRYLNFVLPRKRLHLPGYNYLNMPGEQLSHSMLIPPPVGEHFDILWNHGIYDAHFFHSIMPPDTVYISILREPLQQFVSAFEYYGNIPGSYINDIMVKNFSNPLSEYLQHPSKYEPALQFTTYLRNKQAEDLGMRAEHVVSAKLREQYIKQLAAEFHLVMITEYFDESLVLLKRLLCWDLKDVIYIPKNKNNLKKQRMFSSDDLARHEKLSRADYDLYEVFHERFLSAMRKAGNDFHEEVDYFRTVLGKVNTHCRLGIVLNVATTRWNKQFNVTEKDCWLMKRGELHFLDQIVLDAVRRYQSSLQYLTDSLQIRHEIEMNATFN